jgi:hypothetical protein
MKIGMIGGMVALAFAVSTAAAQQTPGTPPNHRPGMEARGTMGMAMMDSLNHRLDSLVDRMNRATGNQKTQAMAAVINELVAQRKIMQGHMHRMMQGEAMKGMMRDSSRMSTKPTARDDGPPADSTDHAAHHPPQ